MKASIISLELIILFVSSITFSISDIAHATECPIIRPLGLTATQVAETVLSNLSQTFSIERNKIDTLQTLKAIDRSDNLVINYAFFVISITDTLGFDATAIFHDAAKAKGNSQPYEALTIQELMAISRKAYFDGNDTPFPTVRSGAKYKTGTFSVLSPAPSENWLIIRCGFDLIQFQHRDDKLDITTNAMVKETALKPYKNREQFLSEIKAVTDSLKPSGVKVRSVRTEFVENTPTPCVIVNIRGEVEKSALFLSTRFCYMRKDSVQGYAAMYSQLGLLSEESFNIAALNFINGATALP